VIGPPLNDGDCLVQLTALVVQRLNEYAPIACRFGSTAELAAWIRSRPQRADVGDPSDGPKIACDVPQRVRVPATLDPNCFERAALYLGAAELIDPTPLRQLATIGDAGWRHTFPVENGQPVVLDPDLGDASARTSPAPTGGAARNALPMRAVPPPTREQQLLSWLCDIAAAPAFAIGGEEALCHVRYARRVLEQLGMLDQVPRSHDSTLTLDAVRDSSEPAAALARYDLGLVVALAQQGAAYTDQPEQALTLVALTRGMLANLGLLVDARNQILDPYSSSAPAPKGPPSKPGDLLLDPFSNPPGKPLPPMPSVLDPYPSTPAPFPRPAPAPAYSFPPVLDPYTSTPAPPPRPAPPAPSSLGDLSPITPIGVPSLPKSAKQTPPDRYSPDDEENAIFSAIATEQRLLAEDAAKDAAAKVAAAINAPPPKPKAPRHKRQVLDPSNDPQLAAILAASLASPPVASARNCACGGSCSACQMRAAEHAAASTVGTFSASTVIAAYRNCPCGGACASCNSIARAQPRNIGVQDVGDVVHSIGGGVLDFFHLGALKDPIGGVEEKIGFIHHQPTPDEQVKAILAKLSPDDQAKAKSVFDSLNDDQRKQLVAFLGSMPPDQAAAFVRKNLSAVSPSGMGDQKKATA
jgi:hypothetical protein